MKLNGNPLVHKDALKPKKMAHPFLQKPESTIIAGPGIIAHTDETSNITTIGTATQSTIINAGIGIDVYHDSFNDNYTIGLQPSNTVPHISRIESKPIFMIGLPSSTPPDSLQESLERLETKMPDYHVLLLINKTDTYTAKMFRETGTETLSIDEIKKYIDQKIK